MGMNDTSLATSWSLLRLIDEYLRVHPSIFPYVSSFL